MYGVNKVIILGNVGTAPELNQTKSGSAVCNFTVATNRVYKGQDGQKVEDVQWHRVVVWGKQGENANLILDKGSPVYVEGRIETREYEKDGEKKYSTEIICDRFVAVGGKGESSKDGGSW